MIKIEKNSVAQASLDTKIVSLKKSTTAKSYKINEEFRIIPEDSPVGQSFQHLIEQFAREIYKPESNREGVKKSASEAYSEFLVHDFDKYPVRFLLADIDEKNACFVSNPPAIIINKGLFKECNAAYLVMVIAHEMTHLKFEMRGKGHYNDKVEETTANTIAVLQLYHSNFAHPEYCLSTVGKGESVNFSRIVDEHPSDAALRQAYNAVLTNLERTHGNITPTGTFTQQDIYDAIIDTVSSAKYISHLDRIKKENGYDDAPLDRKIEILNDTLIRELSNGTISDVRYNDMLGELKKILINDPKNDKTKKEEMLQASSKIIEAADEVLKVMRSFKIREADDYFVILESEKKFRNLSAIYYTYCCAIDESGEIVPIGSLEPLAKAVRSFIENFYNEDLNGLSTAAKEIITLYEAETLTFSEYGLRFLRNLSFEHFDEPREKFSKKKRDYIYSYEWKALRDYAEKNLDIAKAAVIIGLGRDPKILVHFTDSAPEDYLAFKGRHGDYSNSAITSKPSLPSEISERWQERCMSRELECYNSKIHDLCEKAFRERDAKAINKLAELNQIGKYGLIGLEYFTENYEVFFMVNPIFNGITATEEDNFLSKIREIRNSIKTEADKKSFIDLIFSIHKYNPEVAIKIRSLVLYDNHGIFDRGSVFTLIKEMNLDVEELRENEGLRHRILELAFDELPKISSVSDLFSIKLPDDLSKISCPTNIIWDALAIEYDFLIQGVTDISEVMRLLRGGWYNPFFPTYEGLRDLSHPIKKLWPLKEFEKFSAEVSRGIKEYLKDPNITIDDAINSWILLDQSGFYTALTSYQGLEIILDRIEKNQNSALDTMAQCTTLFSKSFIHSLSLKKRIASLYAKAFVEINGLDDSSEDYKKKVENVFSTSFSLRIAEICEAMAWHSCAQRDLSYYLEKLVVEFTTEEGGDKRFLAGIVVDDVINYSQKRRDDRNALLDFLFSKGDDEAAEQFCDLFSYFFNSEQEVLPQDLIDNAKLFYKTFYEAPLPYRAVFLSAILTDSKEKRILDDDFQNLIEKIIPSNIEYSSEGRKLLNNHLQTFKQYSKDLLLASLLAANDPSDVYDVKSVGQILTIFAENMGPAYIKVMQGVEGNPMLPLDLREDITKHAKRLKFDGARPTRWELMHIIDDLDEDIKEGIEHVGEILGNASMNIAVEVTLKGGKHKVLSLLRPYSQEKAEFGFSRISQTADAYNGEWATTMRDMADGARERAILEADCDLAKSQYDAANSWYDGVSLKVNGTTYEFSSAHVDRCGKGYYFMNKIEGTLFAELSEKTKKQEIFKKECGIAILTHELSNILNGHFDSDRHSGQMKIQRRRGKVQIGHFDFKGTVTSAWSNEDYEQFVDVLVHAISGGADNSFSAHTFVQAEEEIRKKGQEIRPLVLEVQKALFSLSEYTTPLEKEELMAVFAAAVNNGVCEPLQEAVTKRLSSLSPDMQAKLMQSFSMVGNTGLEIEYLN